MQTKNYLAGCGSVVEIHYSCFNYIVRYMEMAYKKMLAACSVLFITMWQLERDHGPLVLMRWVTADHKFENKTGHCIDLRSFFMSLGHKIESKIGLSCLHFPTLLSIHDLP